MPNALLPEEHRAIPIFGIEDLYWEDFEVGHQVRTIRRTISEGESMAFNTLVVDMHPNVADEIFAREEGLIGKRLVEGAFVFSAGIGLVATNWLQAFSNGYDRQRFIKPTFINDTIYTILTNLEKIPKYEERGLTRAKYEVYKNEGELVLYCEHLQTVLYRDPEAIRPLREKEA
jgi:acyl dehydratase